MFWREQKAKRWTKKQINRNLKTITPIDCEQYIHNADHTALVALKKIPLLDTICSKFLSLRYDTQENIINMSEKIHITKKQLPKIYNMVYSICKKIGIDMPDLYLELDRQPNAYTYGTERFTIVIHSGLLECLEDDEIYAVLAHECGHIACKHCLYKTLGRILFDNSTPLLEKIDDLLNKSFIGSFITSPAKTSLELAFSYWDRCSELSADRIAIICCGSAEPVIETMMRLAGGTTHIDLGINRDLFIEQAEEYNELTAKYPLNKTIEYFLTKNRTHPLLAVRAFEAQKFANSEEFKNIK